ncbi:MAG: ATP synthase subunit I [Azoarcus sp.]|nr:ATP synthase subunit I [Azoarcus sp.]
MLKAVYLQICATLAAAALAAVFFGVHGAISAALGGLVCVVPNALFALRMKALSSRSGGPGTAMAFVVGEFFKIVAIVGLLVLIGLGYPDLHWGALFIGLILALKANLFAFLVKT